MKKKKKLTKTAFLKMCEGVWRDSTKEEKNPDQYVVAVIPFLGNGQVESRLTKANRIGLNKSLMGSHG